MEDLGSPTLRVELEDEPASLTTARRFRGKRLHSDVDNLEEVFENREQIEISRYFERLPKSTTVAAEELINDELFHRKPDKEEEEDNICLD